MRGTTDSQGTEWLLSGAKVDKGGEQGVRSKVGFIAHCFVNVNG